MTDKPLTSRLQHFFERMSPAQNTATPTTAQPVEQKDDAASDSESRDSDSVVAARVAARAQHLPWPLLRLELRDLRHDGTQVFLDNVNTAEDIGGLVGTVANLLYLRPVRGGCATPTSEDSSRPHPYDPNIPKTRSVTIVVRDMDGVAYTTGNDLDNDHKEIHLSLSFIVSVAKQASTTERPSAASQADPPKPMPTAIIGADNDASSDASSDLGELPLPRGRVQAIRHELLGVLCHELVHCYQWDAKGTINGGLLEGIADYVRLRALYVPPHWKRVAKDQKWDAGYQVTAYFLDWLEGVKGEGGVRRLNQALCDSKWDEKKIWNDIYGEDVGVLWKRYAEHLQK